MTTFGLALGGGGVKGLAHIALLKKLDELGAKPTCIAGTSMGAILGALYAAGLSGAEIEERVKEHIFSRKDSIKQVYRRRQALVKWTKVFTFEKSRGGLFTADGLFEHLFTEIVDLDFRDLNIPFAAVATDFNSGQEVPLTTGPLLPAVQASMAVPGVFAPVKIGDKLLVDGGIVNNVPCDYVKQDNKLTIASDVICLSSKENPKAMEVLSGSLSIMLRAATELKYAQNPPDFIFRPNTEKIDAFDFHKIRKVLERGETAMHEAGAELDKLLAN